MHLTKIARFEWSAMFSTGIVYRIYCQAELLLFW